MFEAFDAYSIIFDVDENHQPNGENIQVIEQKAQRKENKQRINEKNERYKKSCDKRRVKPNNSDDGGGGGISNGNEKEWQESVRERAFLLLFFFSFSRNQIVIRTISLLF